METVLQKELSSKLISFLGSRNRPIFLIFDFFGKLDIKSIQKALYKAFFGYKNFGKIFGKIGAKGCICLHFKHIFIFYIGLENIKKAPF